MTEIEAHYRQYFKLFREFAPDHMVKWGGYQSGEPTGMASSLECILEFAKLVKEPDAVILNAGAGASSWVLRKLFKNVHCIDPDLHYLLVVQDICRRGGLSYNNFGTGNFIECDYCLYDYGNLERIPDMQKAIDCTRKALYIDDCDTRTECKEMRDYVYSLGLNVTDCEAAKDQFGRWGVILER